MAKVLIPTSGEVAREYVVEQSVGQGGVNVRNDVLLVQYFLAVAMEGKGTAPGYRPPGQRPITVDGICGSQTIAYIRFFQEEGNRRYPGAPTVVDGRVDPVTSGAGHGTATGRFYTILALNAAFRSRRGSNAHDNIHEQLDFPQDLFKFFFLVV